MKNDVIKLNININNIEVMKFTRDNYDKLITFAAGHIYYLKVERRINGYCTCVFKDMDGDEFTINEGTYVIKIDDIYTVVYPAEINRFLDLHKYCTILSE